MTTRVLPDRRAVLLGAAATLIGAACARPAAAAPAVVTLLGDSISAGYGLRPEDALPARLQEALAARGVAAVVRGAGVSGDTTGGGLARVGRDVRDDTDLAVVALGGNDLFAGVAPSRIRANIDGILKNLSARGIGAVVSGMRVPSILFGFDFAESVEAAFREPALARGAVYHPFLLEGVALVPSLNLNDRIHPNPAGIRVIAGNLAGPVEQGLKRRA